MPRTPTVTFAALAAGGVLLAACASPNFKSEAEKYLESDEVAEITGYRFADSECEEPASTSVGTMYACTAVADDGSIWDFDVEITGDRELTVVEGRQRD